MDQKHGSDWRHTSPVQRRRVEPSEEMTDYLIRAETLSSSLEVAGEKISEKLLVSVVFKCLPDSYEYFKTLHDFSSTRTPFSDLKKAEIFLRIRRS